MVFWSCAALAILAAILLFFATGGGMLFAMLAVGAASGTARGLLSSSV
jgi:hypothetical protein